MFASDQPYGDFHLVTPRLACRRFTGDDRPAFARLYSDPDIMRHLADGVPFSPRQIADRFTRVQEHYRRQGFGMWALVDRQTLKIVGRAGLQHLSGVDEVEVGYALFPEHWGKGLATEIAGALVRYGFEKLNFPRIVALVSPQNTASMNVLEKIHMHNERVLTLSTGNVLLFSAQRVGWQLDQSDRSSRFESGRQV